MSVRKQPTVSAALRRVVKTLPYGQTGYSTLVLPEGVLERLVTVREGELLPLVYTQQEAKQVQAEILRLCRAAMKEK